MTLEDMKRLERVYRGIIVKILVSHDMGEKSISEEND